MSPKLREILHERYPSLFSLRLTDEPYRGIEAPDGWFDIIDTLCSRIVSHPIGKDLKVFQIKEKFGGLRFYTSGTALTFIDGLNEAYEEAQHASYRTCEKCGAPGVTSKISFATATLCADHLEEYKAMLYGSKTE